MVQGLRFRVKDLGFRVDLRAQDLLFGAAGLGLGLLGY